MPDKAVALLELPAGREGAVVLGLRRRLGERATAEHDGTAERSKRPANRGERTVHGGPLVIECRTMASAERYDVFALMRQFRGDEGTLGEALALFIDRPDYGFIWLAYDDDHPAGCVSVSYGIDSEAGGLVATLRDLYVVPERRRRGIGSALLLTLHARLAQRGRARGRWAATHALAVL